MSDKNQPQPDERYTEETVKDFLATMNRDFEIRLREQENERLRIEANKDIALSSMQYQADYLKGQPKQFRFNTIVFSIVIILLMGGLGWFYINGGNEYVKLILSGLFYLGSVYISYKVGVRTGRNEPGYTEIPD